MKREHCEHCGCETKVIYVGPARCILTGGPPRPLSLDDALKARALAGDGPTVTFARLCRDCAGAEVPE